MLSSGAGQAGIDGPTMTVEDSHTGNTFMSSSMDVKKMIALIGAFYWILMTVLIVPGAIVASFITLMLPALVISVPLHNWIDHKLCRMVNDHWVSASQCTGLNVVEYGDDITEIADKRVLFMANHLGLVDHFVLMSAMYNKGSIAAKYLWVIFNIWKMTPLGAMWLTHGNFFINGGASQRNRILEEFKQHLKKYFWKHDFGWIVMYPEGSRLYLIKESNARYAAKNGLKIFRHCALPRSGAAHAVLEVAGKRDECEKDGRELARCGIGGPIEYIVDCTIGYYKGDVPELGKHMMGEFPHGNPTVCVHYKIHPTKPEWSDEAVLKEWLYERYEEKDELLDAFYKKGTFPVGPKGRARPVQFTMTRCIIVETFWMILFYAHYSVWIRPLSLFMFQYITSPFV